MAPPSPLDNSGNCPHDGALTDHHQDNSPNCPDDSYATRKNNDDDNIADDRNHDNIASDMENNHQLPPNFEMYKVQPLNDEQKRHCIAFYQSAWKMHQ